MSVNNIPSDWTIRSAGDTAIIIEFGDSVDLAILNKVTKLDTAIQKAFADNQLDGLLETVPTFRSLAVILDPGITTPEKLVNKIAALSVDVDASKNQKTRHWKLPVCYGDEFGPDLPEVAEACEMSEETVIKTHLDQTYVVYMLGFQPGYAFMGDINHALRLPRRTEPRLRVPAGSVAIANQLTGIYPWESPGGWHVIGRCPTPLFSGHNQPPALLRSGDKVSFKAIDLKQYKHLMDTRAAGEINLDELRADV